MNVRVICIGLGAMGIEIAAAALTKTWIEIVGAVDPDPKLDGKLLADLPDLSGAPDLMIQPTLTECLNQLPPAAPGTHTAAIVATSSDFNAVVPLLETLFGHGIYAVSTCENMIYPSAEHSAAWNRLNRLAEENSVAAVGTGINPGFVMDLLPIVLTSPCISVRRIDISRSLDTGRRRESFRHKMGVGQTEDGFRAGKEDGSVSGHAGLEVSLRLTAAALGMELAGVRCSSIKPRFLEGSPEAAGLEQSAEGRCTDGREISLSFSAYEGAEEYDSIVIEGDPPVNLRISPCIHGDRGTAGMVINTIPGLLKVSPGMHTLTELPLHGLN